MLSIVLVLSIWGFLNPKLDKVIIDNKKKLIVWYNGYSNNVAVRKYFILW